MPDTADGNTRAQGTPAICTPLVELTDHIHRHDLRLVAIAGEKGIRGPLGDVIDDTEDHRKRIRKIEMTLAKWMGVAIAAGIGGGKLLEVIATRLSG